MTEISEIIEVIQRVRDKVTLDTDVIYSGYESRLEIQMEIDLYIEELRKGEIKCLEALNSHFLPTCTFQELPISNGWGDEFIEIASTFDLLYLKIVEESGKGSSF